MRTALLEGGPEGGMVYEVGGSDVPVILFHSLGAPTLLEEPDVVAVWQPDKMWYEVEQPA